MTRPTDDEGPSADTLGLLGTPENLDSLKHSATANQPPRIKRRSWDPINCAACDSPGPHRYTVTFAHLVPTPGLRKAVASWCSATICKPCAEAGGRLGWKGLPTLRERRAVVVQNLAQAAVLDVVPPVGGMQ